MLVNLYRSKTPTAIFSLPILVALVCIVLFFREPSTTKVYFEWQNYYIDYIHLNPFLNYFLAVALISITGHNINKLFNLFTLFGKPTYLPGLVYVLILASLDAIDFSPLLISHLLIVFGLIPTFKLRREEQAKDLIFFSSFFIGFSFVFSPFSAAIIIAPWIGLALSRTFVWREWIMVILGALLPLLYYYSFNFILTNSLWIDFSSFTIELPSFDFTIIELTSFSCLIVVGFMAIIRVLRIMKSQGIRFKKQIQFLFILLVITFLLFGLSFFVWGNGDTVFAIPLSMLIAVNYLYVKNTMIVNIGVMVWLLIALLNLWSAV